MRRSDIEALGELAGDALSAGGGLIQQMHEGIASRPFAAVGAAAKPVRLAHDAIERTVYGGVRRALRVAGLAGTGLLARQGLDDGPPLESTPLGSFGLAVLNGLHGDLLSERGDPLTLEMEVRTPTGAVEIRPDALRRSFPGAGSRIVVFLHGLCETDRSWSRFALAGEDDLARSYGERLRDELCFTPVYVRYNTGLRISHNGRQLARLLEALVESWPIAVDELVLVGHSMGGLVGRSACHYAEQDGLRFTAAVRDVFCLGAPHLGADLEKGANALAWAFGRLPETRAFASLINGRSVGIKDLRFGSCIEEDWCDCDPDELLRDRCREVPFLAGATYYFVGARLDDGPLGSLIGDLLVRIPSASGRGNGSGRRIAFEVDNGMELSGLTHFDLLGHPAVYEQLRTWLTRSPALLAA